MRLNGKQTIYQMIQLADRDSRARRRAPRAALVQARIPPPARPAHRRPHSRACATARSGPTTARPRRRGRCWKTSAPRPAAVPGQRHRRAVRQARGRAAGPDPLLRPAHLRRPGRLQDVLQEDGHRPDPPRERDPGRAAPRPSATATSRSRTPRRSAAWPSRSPATRRTTAPAGWTTGSANGSPASAPTSSSPTSATPRALLELILGS